MNDSKRLWDAIRKYVRLSDVVKKEQEAQYLRVGLQFDNIQNSYVDVMVFDGLKRGTWQAITPKRLYLSPQEAVAIFEETEKLFELPDQIVTLNFNLHPSDPDLNFFTNQKAVAK